LIFQLLQQRFCTRDRLTVIYLFYRIFTKTSCQKKNFAAFELGYWQDSFTAMPPPTLKINVEETPCDCPTQVIMDMSLDFQPGQILSLEHGDRNLYAELIQVVVSRQLCWVRPLLLVTHTPEMPIITDLRDGSDLLWPGELFRPALDTEVITFLSQLLAKEPKSELDKLAKQQLHQFIHQLWQAYQEGVLSAE
jgi:hypothetical protein